MIHDNAWITYGAEDLEKLEKLSADYIAFLNNGKTERECADELVAMAEAKGYRNLTDVIIYQQVIGKSLPVYICRELVFGTWLPLVGHNTLIEVLVRPVQTDMETSNTGK